MTKALLQSFKISERWLENIFNIKSGINIYQNTTNSTLLKQVDILFTYQRGRNVNALIMCNITENMEK